MIFLGVEESKVLWYILWEVIAKLCYRVAQEALCRALVTLF
jgi:hypothetical protein